MERYQTHVRDGVVFVEAPDGEVRVGELDDLCEALGGATYSIEYDAKQTRAAWLSLDDDDTLTIDVRETVSNMDYPSEVVETMTALDGGEGRNERISYLREILESAWSAQGADQSNE